MSAETSEGDDELPTPGVPPEDMGRFDDPDLSRHVLERETQDVDCPECGTNVEYLEVQTGYREIATWDGDYWDSDQFQLADDWPEVDYEDRCPSCGWSL